MASTGQTERQQTEAARARRPRLDAYYGFDQPAITPGRFEFTFDLLAGRGRRIASLDSVLESVEWADEQAMLTGSITARRPVADDPASLPIGAGYRVRARVKWGSKWYELWQMRCGVPQIDVFEGVVTVELKDDLDLLKRNRRDWTFRKTKRRRLGWFAHEVAQEVARREGAKLGRVARGTKRITLGQLKNTSGLDVIRKAYEKEKTETGRRFVIRLRNGRLDVVPYERNRLLYVFAGQIESALVEFKQSENPVTVIEAHGRVGKGRAAQKVQHTVFRRKIVDRFGYVHKKTDYGRVDSRAELLRLANRDLADAIKVKPSASITHSLVPFIRRGEGIKLALRSEGFAGEDDQTRDRSFVYTSGVRYRVTAEEQSVELDVAVDDPFHKYREEQEKEQREKARRARRRRAR